MHLKEVIKLDAAVDDLSAEEGRGGAGEDEVDEKIRDGVREEVLERFGPANEIQRDLLPIRV